MKKIIFAVIVFIVLCFSVNNIYSQSLGLSEGWKFRVGDNMQWANAGYDDSAWKPIEISKWWDDQGYKNQGYAWYRIKFVIPSNLKNMSSIKDSIKIYLGKIDECDQTYLNGKLIGVNAGLKNDKYESLIAAWTHERCYALSVFDPAILWDKENVIAVRVYNSSGAGGMYSGKPYIKVSELIDYVNLAVGENIFNTGKNNALSNKVILTNNSSSYNISGILNVLYKVNNKDQKKIFSKDIKVDLAPSKQYLTTINFPPVENGVVVYKFTESVSHKAVSSVRELPYVLTPKPLKSPKINGAKIFGVRPGSPFLFTIPASGERPMQFSAKNLPQGLSLDSKTGMISGRILQKGKYITTLTAVNKYGKYSSEFRIVCGDTLALTPHMGWNSWYVWENHVTDKIMRNAADAMVKSGMINYGYMYVNIDDCWMVKPGSKDSTLSGAPRDSEGRLNSNKRFPDMKALADYIHSQGLKAGLYTSPGKFTCAGHTGAYNYEESDVKRFVEWGFDFLKYDWCSYDEIAPNPSLADLQKPYSLISGLLKKQNRDIVLNLCQYGMGDVWKWGRNVGGNSWRTAGDLGGSFEGIGTAIFRDGFDVYSNNHLDLYSGPGAWNDPDYLLLGYLSNWNGKTVPTPLTPNEQYTHVSLWCLVAAPLIFSGDITRLDPFTLSLLTNDEVIAVDQDSLGKSGQRIFKDGNLEVWMKNMEDGSIAVGLFNRGTSSADVTAKWQDLKISGKQKVRDLWRKKDLGVYENQFSSEVPGHGVRLVRIWHVK